MREAGSTIGPWTLVREIGQGGTATVYEARGPGDARAAEDESVEGLSLVAVVDAALSFDPRVRWPSATTMRHANRRSGRAARVAGVG